MSKKKIIEVNIGIIFIIVGIGVLFFSNLITNIIGGLFFTAGMVLFAFEKKDEHGYEDDSHELNEEGTDEEITSALEDENDFSESRYQSESSEESTGFDFSSGGDELEIQNSSEQSGNLSLDEDDSFSSSDLSSRDSFSDSSSEESGFGEKSSFSDDDDETSSFASEPQEQPAETTIDTDDMDIAGLLSSVKEEEPSEEKKDISDSTEELSQDFEENGDLNDLLATAGKEFESAVDQSSDDADIDKLLQGAGISENESKVDETDSFNNDEMDSFLQKTMDDSGLDKELEGLKDIEGLGNLGLDDEDDAATMGNIENLLKDMESQPDEEITVSEEKNGEAETGSIQNVLETETDADIDKLLEGIENTENEDIPDKSSDENTDAEVEEYKKIVIDEENVNLDIKPDVIDDTFSDIANEEITDINDADIDGLDDLLGSIKDETGESVFNKKNDQIEKEKIVEEKSPAPLIENNISVIQEKQNVKKIEPEVKEPVIPKKRPPLITPHKEKIDIDILTELLTDYDDEKDINEEIDELDDMLKDEDDGLMGLNENLKSENRKIDKREINPETKKLEDEVLKILSL